MLRSLLICLFLASYSTISYTQSILRGIIIDEISGASMPGVTVRSLYPDEVLTDQDGRFRIRQTTGSSIKLFFDLNGESYEFNSIEKASDDMDLGSIAFQSTSSIVDEVELPSITLEEGDDQQDANISGLLQSGDDLFGRFSSYTFSPARFRRRGLESEYSEGYLNNLPINDLESGGIYFSNWGGLNDVMRQDKEVIGAEIAEWGFGGVASTFNTDLRAASQRRQKRVSYAVTNRNYRNRITGTYSTGLLPSGWAMSLSGSRRWAQEGYNPGTFYDGWSYFASVGKKINEHHTLNLVALGAPTKRGGNSTSIQEMYDLAGTNYYNSFWGYQQGKKRSGRVYSGHQPLFMFTHDWIISDKLNLSTALGYQTGKSGVEALDWIYANDPRPDYYRRLPSYVTDATLAGEVRDLLTSDESLRQIQWDNLYETNLNSQFTVEDVDGIEGNDLTGRLAHYVMEERRSAVDKKSGNVVLQYLLSTTSQLTAGLNVVMQDTRNYKVLADLLGGEFYIDWDKFAAQDFPGNVDAQQNDLLRPNRIIYEGDQFGYDYESKVRQQSLWFSYKLDTRKFEIALAGSAKNQTYWRVGQTRNGKFPDNSFGESEKNNFFLPSGKALVRYKFDGRNYLTISGMVAEMAPTFRNAYVSPRTRDNVVAGLEAEQIKLGEIRYDLRAPTIKFAVSGFYLTTQNGIESTSFYHDDLNTFVNFSLTGIDKKYTGIEGAVEYKLIPSLSIHAAASVGQYIYTSRPNATITQDNDGSVLQENITIYAKNLYVSGTPQSAYTAGLTYRSKKFWTLYLNANRYENNWINFNPLRRTVQAVELVEQGSEQWTNILQQEKTDPAWTVDASFYKSWLIKRPKERIILSLNIGVTNLLNNTDFTNGGYEQYRFDYATRDPNRFPTRYSYMQGLNYFIQAGMSF